MRTSSTKSEPFTEMITSFCHDLVASTSGVPQAVTKDTLPPAALGFAKYETTVGFDGLHGGPEDRTGSGLAAPDQACR